MQSCCRIGSITFAARVLHVRTRYFPASLRRLVCGAGVELRFRAPPVAACFYTRPSARRTCCVGWDTDTRALTSFGRKMRRERGRGIVVVWMAKMGRRNGETAASL
jgi:hypothetical protein